VVDIATRAIEESFSLLLDGVENTEEHSVALAKLLSSCFMMRGAQLAIVRRLDPKFVNEIHISSLTWIGKRLAAYENNGNKRGRNTALLFFKVLVPLLGVVDSKDALRIKAHMEQVLAQAKVKPSATSKPWEPQRFYEKRLGNAVSKEKTATNKPRRKKAAKSNEFASSDEEEHEVAGLVERDIAPAKPRPRPRRVTRATAGELSNEESELTEYPSENEAPNVSTPQTQAGRGASIQVEVQPPRLASPTSPKYSSLTNGHATPKQLQKRARSEDTESVASGLSSGLVSEGGQDISAARAPTVEGEIQIKRKRIRH